MGFAPQQYLREMRELKSELKLLQRFSYFFLAWSVECKEIRRDLSQICTDCWSEFLAFQQNCLGCVTEHLLYCAACGLLVLLFTLGVSASQSKTPGKVFLAVSWPLFCCAFLLCLCVSIFKRFLWRIYGVLCCIDASAAVFWCLLLTSASFCSLRPISSTDRSYEFALYQLKPIRRFLFLTCTYNAHFSDKA